MGKISGGIYKNRYGVPPAATAAAAAAAATASEFPATGPDSTVISNSIFVEAKQEAKQCDLVAYEIENDNFNPNKRRVEGSDIINNPTIEQILLLNSMKKVLESQYKKLTDTTSRETSVSRRGGSNKRIKNKRYKKSKRR